VWQNVAATVAACADERPPERAEWPPQVPAAIIERSIATDDPHALKFAEACLGEHRLNTHPAYLAAAADWASRLHRARHWSLAEGDGAGLELEGWVRGMRGGRSALMATRAGETRTGQAGASRGRRGGSLGQPTDGVERTAGDLHWVCRIELARSTT